MIALQVKLCNCTCNTRLIGPVADCADDTAPPASKSRWLAVFYLCIPVGYAAGYILGGLIAPALGWRAAFLLEAAAMLPFATFCAVGPALDLRGKPRRTGTRHHYRAYSALYLLTLA